MLYRLRLRLRLPDQGLLGSVLVPPVRAPVLAVQLKIFQISTLDGGELVLHNKTVHTSYFAQSPFHDLLTRQTLLYDILYKLVVTIKLLVTTIGIFSSVLDSIVASQSQLVMFWSSCPLQCYHSPPTDHRLQRSVPSARWRKHISDRNILQPFQVFLMAQTSTVKMFVVKKVLATELQ